MPTPHTQEPGRVVVSFSADGARLDDLTLWVVAGPPEGATAYQLRVKDFVGLEKAK